MLRIHQCLLEICGLPRIIAPAKDHWQGGYEEDGVDSVHLSRHAWAEDPPVGIVLEDQQIPPLSGEERRSPGCYPLVFLPEARLVDFLAAGFFVLFLAAFFAVLLRAPAAVRRARMVFRSPGVR